MDATMGSETDLFIFKTNIPNKMEFLRIKHTLSRRFRVLGCTIDLDDCDRVLRIECENIPMDRIVEEIGSQGFFCEELPD